MRSKQRRKGVTSQAVVDAFLNRDCEEMETLANRVDESDQLRRYCLVLRDVLRLRREDPFERDREVVTLLRGVLEPPPPDAEIFAVILGTLAVAAWHSGSMADARKASRALAQMEESVTRSLPRVLVLTASSQIQAYSGNLMEARRLADSALALLPGGNTVPRYGLLALRCEAARMAGDPDAAERDLAEMERMGERKGALRVSLAFLRTSLLQASGRLHEALALCDRLPELNRPGMRGMVVRRKILLLLLAGRLAEADELLAAEAECVQPYHCERLKAVAALARGDLDRARELARPAVILAGGAPALTNQAVSLLAQIELAARRPRVARVLLESIDRTEEEHGRRLLWVRLYLQEGNFERAVHHFRKILARDKPELLGIHSLFAYELSAHDLARLQVAAMAPEAAAAVPAPRRKPAPGTPDGGPLVGETEVIRRVREEIDRLAPLAETVLLSGETGTGKDLAARLLHERSGRAAEPFIAVNCAAISDTLIESELFGHVKGAFTGAAADNDGLFVAAGQGTIFLDEIASMSPRLQGALLRVLETGEVRPVGSSQSKPVACRVLAATNRVLEEMVKEGLFRADLYYRLERLRIHLPPLRERREDVPLLTRHFLGRYFEYGEVALGDDLAAALSRHDWPGNVRELRNAVERMAILSSGSRVLGAELFAPPGMGPPGSASPPLPPVSTGAGGSGRPPTAETAPPDRPWRHRARDRQDRLRGLFAKHRDLSRGEVAQLLGCALKTAADELERLRAEGFVERVEPTGSPRTHYFRLRSS